MKPKSESYIKSHGDLEIVTLHELHSALATIIGPDLYDVLGSPPHQEVSFKTRSLFNLFLILAAEIFSEISTPIELEGKKYKISLFQSAGNLALSHVEEAADSGLINSWNELNNWISEQVEFEFWCGSLGLQIKFKMSNQRLLWFGSNTTKHNLLRLSQVIRGLQAHCISGGHPILLQDAVAALEPFSEEIRSRLLYHSSHLVELLGRLFLSVNNVVLARYYRNPTNDVRLMTIPAGVSSDVFADLYGSVLAFNRYPLERITNYTPHTTKYLKMRYKGGKA